MERDFQTFIEEIKNGNLINVENFFKEDFLNKSDGVMRAIHHASMNDKAEVVRFLLEKKCDVNSEDENGWRAIHHAACRSHVEILEILINHKCDIEAEDKNGERAIHLAASKGHEGILQILIKHKCNIEAEDKKGWRAIHNASNNNYEKILQILINHKCNIEAQTKDGWRAIHCAAFVDHAGILQILIDHNCDINCCTKKNESPLQLATGKMPGKCLSVLKATFEDKKKAMEIIRTGEVEEVMQLLEKYSLSIIVNIDTRETVLDLIMERNEEKLNEAVKKKTITNKEISDFHALNNIHLDSSSNRINQENLLYRSIQQGNGSVFDFTCNADVINSDTSFKGSSVLEIVVEYERVMYIKHVLVRLLRDDESWTRALDLAKIKGYDKIVSLISSRQRYLDLQYKHGYTRLHIAVFDNEPDMVDYILTNNCVDTDGGDKNVRSALSWANFMNFVDCIKVFEERKVNVDTTNKI